MDLKNATLRELHTRYLAVMQQAAKPGPVFLAVVKELKSRGITSLDTLERRMGEA